MGVGVEGLGVWRGFGVWGLGDGGRLQGGVRKQLSNGQERGSKLFGLGPVCPAHQSMPFWLTALPAMPLGTMRAHATENLFWVVGGGGRGRGLLGWGGERGRASQGWGAKGLGGIH